MEGSTELPLEGTKALGSTLHTSVVREDGRELTSQTGWLSIISGETTRHFFSLHPQSKRAEWEEFHLGFLACGFRGSEAPKCLVATGAGISWLCAYERALPGLAKMPGRLCGARLRVLGHRKPLCGEEVLVGGPPAHPGDPPSRSAGLPAPWRWGLVPPPPAAPRHLPRGPPSRHATCRVSSKHRSEYICITLFQK